jgi:cation diffusion facilitator CzcD-associated flavoprotein CzcO
MEQRFCIAPDFFKAIRIGKASVVTDHIDRFTAKGIVLKSGQNLEAISLLLPQDLDLIAFGGVEILIDSQPFDVSDAKHENVHKDTDNFHVGDDHKHPH